MAVTETAVVMHCTYFMYIVQNSWQQCFWAAPRKWLDAALVKAVQTTFAYMLVVNVLIVVSIVILLEMFLLNSKFYK